MLLTVAILAPTNGPRNWQKQTAAHATKSLSDPARTGCQKISAQHITYENSYHSKRIQQSTGVSSTAGERNPHSEGCRKSISFFLPLNIRKIGDFSKDLKLNLSTQTHSQYYGPLRASVQEV